MPLSANNAKERLFGMQHPGKGKAEAIAETATTVITTRVEQKRKVASHKITYGRIPIPIYTYNDAYEELRLRVSATRSLHTSVRTSSLGVESQSVNQSLPHGVACRRSLAARDLDEPLTFDVYYLPNHDRVTICSPAMYAAAVLSDVMEAEMTLAREKGKLLAHVVIQLAEPKILEANIFGYMTSESSINTESIYLTEIDVCRFNLARKLEFIAIVDTNNPVMLQIL